MSLFPFLSYRMAVQVESLCKPFALENDPDATYFFHSEKDEDETEGYSTPVPTHDIWKKFELLPTPPRSPSRSPPHTPVDFDSFEGGYCSVADTLQIVTEKLDEDSCSPAPLATVEFSLCSLKSKLIQDCMWNGSNYESTLDVKVLVNTDDIYETPCSTPPPVEYVSSDCVDPATVFPYPINESHQTLCGSHTSSDSGKRVSRYPVLQLISCLNGSSWKSKLSYKLDYFFQKQWSCSIDYIFVQVIWFFLSSILIFFI